MTIDFDALPFRLTGKEVEYLFNLIVQTSRLEFQAGESGEFKEVLEVGIEPLTLTVYCIDSFNSTSGDRQIDLFEIFME